MGLVRALSAQELGAEREGEWGHGGRLPPGDGGCEGEWGVSGAGGVVTRRWALVERGERVPGLRRACPDGASNSACGRVVAADVALEEIGHTATMLAAAIMLQAPS
ncbi:hypothetical protein Sm713_36030 [Streptomyces sp. TS71-3]|nr:hypothetical protein Sm713_36030 [Streptomyces sp. TS71-3]